MGKSLGDREKVGG